MIEQASGSETGCDKDVAAPNAPNLHKLAAGEQTAKVQSSGGDSHVT
jgi:hypothetical protein